LHEQIVLLSSVRRLSRREVERMSRNKEDLENILDNVKLGFYPYLLWVDYKFGMPELIMSSAAPESWCKANSPMLPAGTVLDIELDLDIVTGHDNDEIPF
jgi:hypothetical protein